MVYKYLVLDEEGNAIARGVSKDKPRGERWRLIIEDGDMQELSKHPVLRLVGNSDIAPALEGKVVEIQDNVVLLEPGRCLEQSLRQNLRIPVEFSSFIYPQSGLWKGREEITSKDLSCGGVAFYCPRSLSVGEVVQVVIPVTSQPLLLNMEILRCHVLDKQPTLYAGQFLPLTREEESMVREAVFSIQLKGA